MSFSFRANMYIYFWRWIFLFYWQRCLSVFFAWRHLYMCSLCSSVLLLDFYTSFWVIAIFGLGWMVDMFWRHDKLSNLLRSLEVLWNFPHSLLTHQFSMIGGLHNLVYVPILFHSASWIATWNFDYVVSFFQRYFLYILLVCQQGGAIGILSHTFHFIYYFQLDLLLTFGI